MERSTFVVHVQSIDIVDNKNNALQDYTVYAQTHTVEDKIISPFVKCMFFFPTHF